MNPRRWPLIVLVASVLTLLAVPTAAQPPAPAGDSYLVPVNMKLNETKTITGVEGATLQADDIEESVCDDGDNANYSVWFGFSVPASALVDFDTSGTWYAYDFATVDTAVISVYQVTGPSPIEVKCETGESPRLEDVALDAGNHLVRIAFDGPQTVTGPSQVRLTLRLRYLAFVMDDPHFLASLGEQWKVKKAGDPPQITRSCPSTCTIRFNGAAGGTIKNSAALPTNAMKIRKGDFLYARLGVNNTPPAGANIKLKLTLTYTDGTPSKTVSVVRDVTNTSTAPDSTLAVGYFQIEIKSKAVGKVTMSITSPDDSDTFNVWYVQLILVAGGGRRDAAPQPPPPGP